MRADLHTHSLYSDGAYPPAVLMERAKAAGLACVALTDHDNMGGVGEAADAARALGLTFVRGWEVSSYEGACKVHSLGYGCRENEAYSRFLQERFSGALVRADEMIRKANALFHLDVTMDEVEGYHVRKHAPVHTMHVVTAFARRLNVKRGDLYRDVFARGGPAFSGACRPTPTDAINVIHETGGVAVLAHPGRILDLAEDEIMRYRSADDTERAVLREKSNELRDGLMCRLIEQGLDGIECVYTTHTVTETEHFSKLARRHGLLITGGSDYHQDGTRNVLGLPPFDADGKLLERLLS